MVKSTTTLPSKPSSSKNTTTNTTNERPSKKPRVEIGTTTIATNASKTKDAEKEKKPLKSALKKTTSVQSKDAEKEKGAMKGTKKQVGTTTTNTTTTSTTPTPAVTATVAAPVTKSKGKRKAEPQPQPEPQPEPEVAKEAEVEAKADETKDADVDMEPKTTPKPKAKKQTTKQAPAPPLPKTFKIVAGSYEKLLYGLQGSVSVIDGGNDEGKGESNDTNSSSSPFKFTLKPIFIFPAHVSCIKSVAASPQGGKWLATGSADEIIKVWDLKRRKEVGGLMHHQGSVTTLTFPSRSHLLSASEDGTLALFRARDWSVLRTLKGHKGRVNDIAVHPSGKVALSVGRDGVLRMWDLMRGKGVGSTRLGGKKVEGVEGSGWREGERVGWCVSGSVFAVQSGQGVEVYATNMDVLHSIRHPSRIHDIKFVLPVGESSSSSSSVELLLVGAEDKKTTVYEIATSVGEQETKPRIVAELVGHTNRIKAIQTIKIALPSTSSTTSTSTTQPQSTTLACTVSSDGFIHVYDLSPISRVLSSSGESAAASTGGEPLRLEPVARYDTKKTRLTCVTVADGETDDVVVGKRKRGGEDDDEDVEEDAEDDEDEGKYGEGSGDEEEEEENEEEEEEENEMESD